MGRFDMHLLEADMKNKVSDLKRSRTNMEDEIKMAGSGQKQNSERNGMKYEKSNCQCKAHRF
jgi:hypothetical protein